MLDRFNRRIDYLRVSVTDRCNLRCTYCMPACGIKKIPHSEIITFEEIVEVIKYGAKNGITKIRLTGGEPLVRRGIEELVEQISNIHGIQDISITTNGTLLKTKAAKLAKAGLNRINISLDTLNEEEYSEITRGGQLVDVLKGIDEAIKCGLEPIKINVVKFKDREILGLDDLIKYAENKNLKLRFIHQMNLQNGEFSVVEGGSGGNCSLCNRLRLTSTGDIKPCLFSELSYNIRKLGIENAYRKAIENKPKCGTYNKSEEFYQIGG